MNSFFTAVGASPALPYLIPDCHEGLVVLREIRVQRQVVVGIDARVIGQHVTHFVEAVGRRKVLELVADMPFAELHRIVACLLQILRNGRGLFGEAVGIARSEHGRERGPDRDAAGDERGAARRAARLAVVIHEAHAFGSETVEVGRGRAAHGAAAIRAEIAPAHIVGHDHDDVRLSLRGLRERAIAP